MKLRVKEVVLTERISEIDVDFPYFAWSNNKYVIGGDFSNYKGTPANMVIRLNQDGSIDNTFNIGTGFNDDIRSIVLNNEGVYIIGGKFNTYQNVTYNRFIKLNQDGTPVMVV